MRNVILLLLSLTLAAQVNAKEKTPLSEGLDLFSEGSRLVLEGLMQEMQPMIEGLREALTDLNAYHPPVLLPNGDILIRRRTPLEEPLGDHEIEL